MEDEKMAKISTQPRQLFSGIYRCCDCNTEWEFVRSREIRCPECASDDLEQIQLEVDDQFDESRTL
jgi:hypothetical protein